MVQRKRFNYYSAEIYKLLLGTLVANEKYIELFTEDLLKNSHQDEKLFSDMKSKNYVGNHNFDNVALLFFAKKLGLGEMKNE